MGGTTSEITLSITLDGNKIPERLAWQASDDGQGLRPCKAFNLSIWDAAQGSTLRIDLWTKDLPVGEMTAHFVQTLVTLGEAYERATGVKGVSALTRPLAQRVSEMAAEQLGAPGGG